MNLDWDFEEVKEKNRTIWKMSERAKEITKRRNMLNANFEWWWDKNIAHLVRLFNHVSELQLKMYDEVAQMKKDFDELAAAGVEMYKNYDIEAHIHLRRGIKFPYADDYLLSFMEYCSEFDFKLSNVRASSDCEMSSKEEELHLRLNWNIEIFDYFRKKNDKDPYIPYLFHTVWQDGSVYSLEDLLYIQPDDFVISKEVNF